MNEYQAKDEIYFYLALSYENIQLPQEALSNYNKVISYEQSDLYEHALWNKSQLLLKLDKRKSAINSLNQVKNLKGNYYKQAENQLDSLYQK
jgi:tetratricopeptide (TPR) repeat protein